MSKMVKVKRLHTVQGTMGRCTMDKTRMNN